MTFDSFYIYGREDYDPLCLCHQRRKKMLSIIDALPDNWEAKLEYQLLLGQRDKYSKRAYICSPCRDNSKKAVSKNITAARFYMHHAKNELGFSARAPHAYLPVLLSDMNPVERSLALHIGLGILETSDIVFVCGNILTGGMRGEIEHAAKLLIPIQVFCQDLYVDVRKTVTRAGADKSLVSFESGYPCLGLSTDELHDDGIHRVHA